MNKEDVQKMRSALREQQCEDEKYQTLLFTGPWVLHNRLDLIFTFRKSKVRNIIEVLCGLEEAIVALTYNSRLTS